MKQALVGVTAGLLAGWVVFTPEGKKVAKDICLKAMNPSGDSKIGHILESALSEPDIEPLALEHKPHDHATIKDHEVPGHKESIEVSHTHHATDSDETHTDKSSKFTHEPSSAKIKEMEDALHRAEKDMSPDA